MVIVRFRRGRVHGCSDLIKEVSIPSAVFDLNYSVSALAMSGIVGSLGEVRFGRNLL